MSRAGITFQMQCYVSGGYFSLWRKQVVLIFSCRNKPSLSAAVQVSLLALSRPCVCPALLLAWFMSRLSQVQMVVSPLGSPSVPIGSLVGLDSKANIEHSRTGADRKVHTGASVQCEVNCVGALCVCLCAREQWYFNIQIERHKLP